MAIPSSLALIAGRHRISERGRWLLWAPTPVLFWHQTEEWVLPGGFLPYVNRNVLRSGADEYPLTRRLGLFINVGPGWGLNLAAATLGMRVPLLATTALAMLIGNAAFHGVMAVRYRSYNPGLATAVTLLAPLGSAGLVSLGRDPRVGRRDMGLGMSLGLVLSLGLFLTMRGRVRGEQRTNARTQGSRVVQLAEELLHQILRPHAELLKKVRVLLVVHLVGQLFCSPVGVLRPHLLPNQVDHRLLVELHVASFMRSRTRIVSTADVVHP
jgi:hypothetical protein